MKKYLLDTNIISYLEKENTPEFKKIITKLQKLENNDILSISMLTLFEYQTSISLVENAQIKEALVHKKSQLLKNYKVENLEFQQEVIFGELQRQYLDKTGGNIKGIKKHNIDFLIASQVIFKDMILVSNDNIFKTISEIRDDFKYDNWIN